VGDQPAGGKTALAAVISAGFREVVSVIPGEFHGVDADPEAWDCAFGAAGAFQSALPVRAKAVQMRIILREVFLRRGERFEDVDQV
jgi:hypothetical protein